MFDEGTVHRKRRRDDFPNVWSQKMEREAISREGTKCIVRGLSTGNGEEMIFKRVVSKEGKRGDLS